MNIDLVREDIEAARNELRYIRDPKWSGVIANIEQRLITALAEVQKARPARATAE